MNNEQGKTYFGIGLDNSELQNDAQTAKQSFQDIEDKATSVSNNIDSAYDGMSASVRKKVMDLKADYDALGAEISTKAGAMEELNSNIQAQEEAVSNLSTQYSSLNTQMGEAFRNGEDETYNKLKESLVALKAELEAEQAELTKMKEALSYTADESTRLQQEQDKVAESINKTTQNIGENESFMVKMLGGTKNYNNIISLLPDGLKSVVSGIANMTKAAMAFIATPLGAIIAAIVLGLKALSTWFTSSAEGQMAFIKGSAYLSGILGQLKEIVIAVGKAIYKAFTDPKEAIKDLWYGLKTNLINRLKGIIDSFQAVGKVISSALSLDWDGVKDGAKDYANALLKIGTGVDDVIGKTAKWGQKTADIAKKTAELKVAEEQLARDRSAWSVKEAEYEAKRRAAEAKIYTSKDPREQKKAIKEAEEAIDAIYNQREKFAAEELRIRKEMNSLTTNAQEDYDAENTLQANLTRLQAERDQAKQMLRRRGSTIDNKIDNASTTTEDYYKAEVAIAKKYYDEETALKRKQITDNIELIKFDRDETIKAIEAEKTAYIELAKKAGKKADTSVFDKRINLVTVSADMEINKENQEAFNEVLKSVETYEQKRNSIAEKYSKARKQLYKDDGKTLKEGVTTGNIEELNRQEKEALEAIDEQFVSREEEYNSWVQRIISLSIKSLKNMLKEAQTALDTMENDAEADPEKLARARAEIAQLEKQIKSIDSKNSKTEKADIKWTDLYDTLCKVNGIFMHIGDSIGGTTGKMISSIGQVTGSTLQMASAITKVGQVAGAAEKASAILAGIAAAIQATMFLVSMFNNDEALQAEIEHLQNRIDQLQWEIDNADIVRLQKNTIDVIKQVNTLYREAHKEILRQYYTAEELKNVWTHIFGSAKYNQEIIAKGAEKIAEAYLKIGYTADKALGSNKYKGAKADLKNIAEQQILIQKQINAEQSKKNTDDNKITDYEQKMQELALKAATIVNDMVEDIIGNSAEDLASELGDAFIEAFQAGEDAAEAWGEKVDDIVSNIMKRMIITKYLEEPLGKVFDKYKDMWFSTGDADLDSIMSSMDDFANDLNNIGGIFKDNWEKLPESIKSLITTTDEATRKASSKGIATASQDSIDELNGRMTAVQGHTYSISENIKIIQPDVSQIRNTIEVMRDYASQQLQALLAIRDNTSRLENIEDDMKTVKNTVNDIALKGIKLK